MPDHPVFNDAEPDRSRDVGGLGAGARARTFSASAIRATSISSDSQRSVPVQPGAKTGALVEARVGKGRWIYIGLGLWRQLPAGTDGAYQLMANLISLRRPVHDHEVRARVRHVRPQRELRGRQGAVPRRR